MIRVNNVVKTFGDFRALDGVNLHVRDGAIYGLVGPNGAGKSTIIRHITGIYKPDAGNIEIAGMPVYENPQAKARFAYIPDDLFYFQQADVMELMILDEPVDGLDPVMRRQIWSIIMSDVAEHGTTVLVSSHNLRELEDVCDHVGIMHHGKVMLERSLSELQGSVCKIQVAYQERMPKLPADFEVLHMSSTGRVYTMIVKGNPKEAKLRLEQTSPMLIDVLPLTLEEIFIYELGGADYAVKDILL